MEGTMVRLGVIGALLMCWTATPREAAAGIDLSGTWAYATSNSWKKGPCPTGRVSGGKLKIEQKGKGVTLTFLSGQVCRPKSMCTFKGTVSGNTYTFSNSAVVDGEGGKVENKIRLTASSSKQAEGKSASHYVHPGGMKCSWGFDITLTRK
jgi:hypothetical protein